jgi:hypothetical protein
MANLVDKIYDFDTYDEKDLNDLSYYANEYFEEMQYTNEDLFHNLIHTLRD